MKKNGIRGVGIALVMAIALMAMITGCPNDNSTSGDPHEKTLTAFKIAGIAPDDAIPDPITQEEWDDADTITFTNQGKFTIPTASLANASLSPTVTGGSVTYWKGDDYDRANASFTSTKNLSFAEGDILFVRVTAGDKTINYYKFIITTPTSSASLYTLTIAGQAASTGVGAETWDAITVPGKAELTGAQKTSAQVTATANQGAAVRFAQVTGAGAPAFGDTDTFTFADGDFLFIEVTSADGSTVMVYKVILEIGHNAKLESLGVETPKAIESEWDDIDTWAKAIAFADVPGNAMSVTFQTDRQPTGNVGLGIRIVAQDPAATIVYFLSGANDDLLTAEPTWVDYPSTGIARQVFNIEKKYFLYVKVTSDAGTDNLYFIKQLLFPAKGKLTYGNPNLSFDSADMAFWTSDNNIQTFYINRVNESENGVAEYLRHPEWDGLHTSAAVKAVWNDEGIFLYADVTTTQFRETATGALRDRPIGYADPGDANGAHLGDSFEVFVNERLQKVVNTSTQADIGNQFRVDAAGIRTGRYAGQGGTLGTNTASGQAALEDFIANGQRVVRLKNDNGAATATANGGYEVLVFVPFSEMANIDANEVFVNGTVKDGAEIGLELQLNTSIEDTKRDGILTWNGVTTGSYAHAENYGVVELNLDSKPRVTNAQTPTITTQPVGNVYLPTATTASPLTVVATTTQTGSVLSYQWYKVATPADIAVGTNAASYTPDISDGETHSYYVVVTNTNNSVNGDKVRSVTSNKVSVGILGEPEPFVARISAITGIAQPVFGFYIPADKKLSDYTKVTFDLKQEGTINGRWRVYGPYTVTTSVPTNSKLTLNNAASTGTDGQLISATGLGTAAVSNTWTSTSIALNATIPTPAGNKTGLVALSIGGIDAGTTSYRIKNIVLTNDTDSVKALKPGSSLLWGGSTGGYNGVGTAVYAGESSPTLKFHFYDDESDIPTLPPVPDAPAAATEPFEVDLTKSTATSNLSGDAWGQSNYNNGFVFKLVDSTGTEIDVGYVSGKTYSTATVVLKIYDTSKNEITDAMPENNLQAKFHRTVVANANGATVGSPAQIGLSSSNTAYDDDEGAWIFTVSVPANLHCVEGDNFNWVAGTLGALSIQSGNAHDVQYIEVLTITLE